MKDLVREPTSPQHIEEELPIEEHSIADSSGKAYPLYLTRSDDIWVMKIQEGKLVIGQANCPCHGKALFLGNIQILDVVPLPQSFWRKLLRLKRLSRSYRGLGLGSALLNFIIDQARSSGFHQITGNLHPPDLKAFPGLPDWYRKLGFEVTMSSPEAGSISLKLNSGTEAT